MRITNFNAEKDTWTAWKKTYIDDLNIKITSLWNHLVYQNPPYVILNSITDDSPVNLDEAGYRITVTKANDGSKVNIYFPTRLQLHQGFYNNSNYGDAVLGYYGSNNMIYPISTNKTFTPFKFKDENTRVYIESYDFLSGYCCISNLLPDGPNDETNEKRQQISSYWLYPIGSGSFFTYQINGRDLIANYYKNNTGSFVNRTIFSLVSNGRYNTQQKSFGVNGFWNTLNCGLESSTSPCIPQIADSDGNIWSGHDDIVAEVYNNDNELVICDSKYNISDKVVFQTLLWRAELSTNIQNTNNYRVEVY